MQINQAPIKTIGIALTILVWLPFCSPGCNSEERGPVLAGGREIKSWIAEIHDANPKVRRQAVLKLGNVGDSDRAVVDALTEALHDSDVTVRRDAVLAAVKLKRPGEAIKTQLETMSRDDKDARVREVAQKAVALLGAG